MKKIFAIVISCVVASLLSSCLNVESDAVTSNDLRVVGIKDYTLVLDGTEGCSTTFTISKASYDWSIIDYKGFTCEPNHGAKVDESSPVTVTVTPLRSNNTADTVRLSSLNFKMLSTRFVGISAYQLPQICLINGDRCYVDAVADATTTVKFVSKGENIQITTTGEIEATLGTKNSNNEYTIVVKALQNNPSAEDQSIGSVGFVVDGVAQDTKIDVMQIAAIQFDRTTIMLSSKAGVGTTFSVEANSEIEVSNTSSLFTVEKVKGKEYMVRALSDNTSDSEQALGTISVSLLGVPDCKATIAVRQHKVASQTIIAKFVGTALDSYFNVNVSNMLNALNTDIQGDAILLAITTDSTTDATLYELRYDAALGKAVKEKIQELSLPTPYDAALFEANLRAALDYAPAEKYALVVGSHGFGWVPKNPTVSSVQLMKVGAPSLLWSKPYDSLTRHIGDGDNVRYDVTEIATAIAANSVKFDYILFDACYMANIETAYELRNAAKYMVASPCEVLGAGFPYSKILPYMLEERGTSYDLDKVCNEYVEHYKNSAGVNSACVSMIHMEELEALAATVKAVNSASLKENFSLNNLQVYDGIDASHNPVHMFYDLGDMVEQSCADADAVEAFKQQLTKSVTSLYHTDKFWTSFGNKYYDIKVYNGVTTSAMVDLCSELWQQTAWYKATH